VQYLICSEVTLPPRRHELRREQALPGPRRHVDHQTLYLHTLEHLEVTCNQHMHLLNDDPRRHMLHEVQERVAFGLDAFTPDELFHHHAL